MFSLLADGYVTSLLYAFFCFLFVAIRANNAKILYPVDWTILSMGFVYGICFALVLIEVNQNSLFVRRGIFEPYEGVYGIHTLAATFAAIGIIVGWKLFPNIGYGFLSSIKDIYSYNKYFWFILFLSVLTTYMYTIDYGGIIGALDYSHIVRAGLITVEDRSTFSFLKPFTAFSNLSLIGFLGIISSGRKGFLVFLGVVLSIIVSIYQVALDLGRMNFLIVIAVIFLAGVIKKRMKPTFIVTLFLVFCTVGLYAVFVSSNYFDRKGADSFSFFIAKEVSFVFTSFFLQLADGRNLSRGFLDVIVTPIYLAPARFYVDWLVGPSEINTILHAGSKKGEFGVTGGIPVDIITFGLMQLNFIGVIVCSAIFGVVIRYSYNVASSCKFYGLYCYFMAYVCIKISSYSIFYAFPEHIIASHFPMIFSILILILMRSMKKIHNV